MSNCSRSPQLCSCHGHAHKTRPDEIIMIQSQIKGAMSVDPNIRLLVEEFNTFSRPDTLPLNIPNHWNFHIDVSDATFPPSYVMLIMWNKSREPSIATSMMVRSISLTNAINVTDASKIDYGKAVLEMSIGIISMFFKDDTTSSFAPKSWSVTNDHLAEGTSIAMKTLGVRRELQSFKVCTVDENGHFRQMIQSIISMSQHEDGSSNSTEKRSITVGNMVVTREDDQSYTFKTVEACKFDGEETVEAENKSSKKKKSKKRKNRKKKKNPSTNDAIANNPDLEATAEVQPEVSDSEEEPSTKSQQDDGAEPKLQFPTGPVVVPPQGPKMATDKDKTNVENESYASEVSDTVPDATKNIKIDAMDSNVAKKPGANKPRDWRIFIAVGQIGLNTLEDEHGITPFDIVHPQHRPLSSS